MLILPGVSEYVVINMWGEHWETWPMRVSGKELSESKSSGKRRRVAKQGRDILNDNVGQPGCTALNAKTVS